MIVLEILQESSKATLLQIVLAGTQASPSDLPDLFFPEIDSAKGLVISGFPQWAVAAVVAECKNHCLWIACRDDKLIKEGEFAGEPACIVVWSLDREFRKGDVFPLVNVELDMLAPSAAL
jgi:hypothetical protein